MRTSLPARCSRIRERWKDSRSHLPWTRRRITCTDQRDMELDRAAHDLSADVTPPEDLKRQARHSSGFLERFTTAATNWTGRNSEECRACRFKSSGGVTSALR